MRRVSMCLKLAIVALCAARASAQEAKSPAYQLVEWERGFAVRPRDHESMAIYLWFYEWHLFEAIKPGQHTGGTYQLKRAVNSAGTEATIRSPQLQLMMKSNQHGAEMTLNVTNRSSHAWPAIAAVIPCFNPGPQDIRNAQFANSKTYFLAKGGLTKTIKREIHFNDAFRAEIDREAKDGKYVFSHKWPTSAQNAVGGLLLREATDAGWVAGIAWEDFLTAQAHNPWQCMHLSIRVGPLEPGESKQIRGKIYLFQGNRDDCLKRFREDFPSPAVKRTD